MKTCYDKELIEQMSNKYRIKEYFSNNQIPKFIMEYKKGEYISSTLSSDYYLQFVLEGKVNIYCIREDGSAYSLAVGSDLYIIGDIELFEYHDSSIYAEALTDVVCIAISIKEYKELLLNDIVFTRRIAHSLATKLSIVTKLNAISTTLEDRVYNFMRYLCENNCFTGIEQAAFRLHCSPRHLQRVMNEMEKKAIVNKLGKGKYQLS